MPTCHGAHRHSYRDPRSAGVGNAYYPQLGNAGYHADHYDLQLKVEPAGNQVDSHTTIEAHATQDLSTIQLDYLGPAVEQVQVDGQPALCWRDQNKLVVLPPSPISSGQPFQVEVDYHGQPQSKQSCGGPFQVGWKVSGDNIVVDSQPDGAQTWFPANDHPLNKATYAIHVDVPGEYQVASNGTLRQVDQQGSRKTYHWQSRDPMASYLVTVAIGKFVEERQTGPGGLPILNYFPADRLQQAHADFARTPQMLQHFSNLFGPYPFESYGVIVSPGLDTPLETQTRSLFNSELVTGDGSLEPLVAHELAHQWFGDLVSVKSWDNIVLNEGYAAYSEWLWLEHTQGPAALQEMADDTRQLLEDDPEKIVIGQPPPEHIFHDQVYDRGALALHTLRQTIGDQAFFQATRTYLEEHRGDGAKNPTLTDLRQAMEKSSGQDLQSFFQQWYLQAELPDPHK